MSVEKGKMFVIWCRCLFLKIALSIISVLVAIKFTGWELTNVTL